ncbi:MAG: M56 family metallopeptidase, partial [Oscillospiraceae bacterium]
MNLLTMSFNASILIAAILLLRALAIHRVPKRLFSLCWGVAIIRLLVPLSFPIQIPVLIKLTDPPVPILQEYVPSFVEMLPEQIILAWGIVSILLFIAFVVSYYRGYRDLSISLPCNRPTVQNWLQLQKGKRSIQVRISDQVSQPLTYGVVKPIIVLPKTLDLTDEQSLFAILSHELSHIKRFDTGIKMLLALVVCIHWFNPLVWVMYFLANRDMELACDDLVIRRMDSRQKAAYAQMLLDFSCNLHESAPLFSGFSRYAIP